MLSLLLYSVGTQVNPGSLWEGCTHGCVYQEAYQGIIGAILEAACHAPYPASRFCFLLGKHYSSLTLWALLPFHSVCVAWHDDPSVAHPALQSRADPPGLDSQLVPAPWEPRLGAEGHVSQMI